MVKLRVVPQIQFTPVCCYGRDLLYGSIGSYKSGALLRSGRDSGEISHRYLICRCLHARVDLLGRVFGVLVFDKGVDTRHIRRRHGGAADDDIPRTLVCERPSGQNHPPGASSCGLSLKSDVGPAFHGGQQHFLSLDGCQQQCSSFFWNLPTLLRLSGLPPPT